MSSLKRNQTLKEIALHSQSYIFCKPDGIIARVQEFFSEQRKKYFCKSQKMLTSSGWIWKFVLFEIRGGGHAIQDARVPADKSFWSLPFIMEVTFGLFSSPLRRKGRAIQRTKAVCAVLDCTQQHIATGFYHGDGGQLSTFLPLPLFVFNPTSPPTKHWRLRLQAWSTFAPKERGTVKVVLLLVQHV